MARNSFDPNPKPRHFFSSLSRTQKIMLLALIPVAGFSILPVIFVLLIGLLPTLTIMITDGGNSNKLAIVGCFNVAGAFIYLFDMIENYGAPISEGINGNVFNLIIMLGSAAFGILVYKELPSLFIAMYKSSAQKKLKNIEDRLTEISEIWGEGVVPKNTPKETKAPSQSLEKQKS